MAKNLCERRTTFTILAACKKRLLWYLEMDQYNHPYINREVYIYTTRLTM